jgi:hypothetical protein
VDSYTYMATTSTLGEKKRPKAEIAQLDRSVVSQITLLYMRDFFESDPELDTGSLRGELLALLRRAADLLEGSAGTAIRGLVSDALRDSGLAI